MIAARIARVLALGALFGVVTVPPCPALAAEHNVRAQVGRPMQAAEKLLKQKKYQEALAKLAEADAVLGKTPDEVYGIETTRALVMHDSGDDAGAIRPLEAALATGVSPPAEALSSISTLVILCYRAKDFAKAVAFAERYYRQGGKDGTPRVLMAQAYYAQRDFANAARVSRSIEEEDRRAGRPSDEAVLQMVASSEYQQKHDAAYRDALAALVAFYPKREYWARLIAAVRKRAGFADRLVLDIDRLKAVTGTLATQADYMDAAELALLAELPGEAKSLLDKGYAAGVLGQGPGAERQQRLLAMATAGSAEILKGLPRLGKEAEAAHDGVPSAYLGEVYASYGRWDEAILALQRGRQKGGLSHPEDAKLHLGIAYLEAGQADQATTVLGEVTGADGLRDLAQLWLLAHKTQMVSAR